MVAVFGWKNPDAGHRFKDPTMLIPVKLGVVNESAVTDDSRCCTDGLCQLGVDGGEDLEPDRGSRIIDDKPKTAKKSTRNNLSFFKAASPLFQLFLLQNVRV